MEDPHPSAQSSGAAPSLGMLPGSRTLPGAGRIRYDLTGCTEPSILECVAIKMIAKRKHLRASK